MENLIEREKKALSSEPLVGAKKLIPLLGGIKDRTIRKWAEDGLIPYYQVGSLVMFRMSEIEEWLRDHRIPSKEEEKLMKEARKEAAKMQRRNGEWD